jgi:4,5-dihydroxyphthalate decarboxylase
MYVNTAAGINAPQDLIGKRVGLRSFQTTLSVLAKGDLQHEYGVPLDQVNWVTSTDEPVSFQPPAGVSIERAPLGSDIEEMLVEGEIDAYMVPRMPRPFVAGAPEVSRLFQDSRAEEIFYFQRNGFYPIMHLVAIKKRLPISTPRLPAPYLTPLSKPRNWPAASTTTPTGAA